MHPKSSHALIATAGEALIDMMGLPDGSFLPFLGGAVYNLTRALALQGVPTLYLNPLSADRFGRQLALGLHSAGVMLARPDPVPEVTALAMVAVNDTGHPDYAFYREGVADRATTVQQLVQACQQATQLQLVCTGALALSPEDADIYLPWLQAQRAEARMVVIDANMRPSVMRDLEEYRAYVLLALQLADVIKVSDEDLQHLGLAGEGAMEQARTLLRQTQASWLALTCGAEGAYILTRYGEHFVCKEQRNLRVADTVGAGDCFLAGLLARWVVLGLNRDWGRSEVNAADANSLLAHAVASASLNVQRQGCQPPVTREIKDWLTLP
jgi:fructokinase